MALKFKRGNRVRQIVKAPIEGVIKEQRIVDDDIHFVVEYVNENGKPASIVLSGDQLESIDEPTE